MHRHSTSFMGSVRTKSERLIGSLFFGSALMISFMVFLLGPNLTTYLLLFDLLFNFEVTVVIFRRNVFVPIDLS